jgi:hypothetical protein
MTTRDIPDSEALPVVSHRKRRKRTNGPPATPEERAAINFEAIKAEFDWSNDEWAAMWLPWVRIAAMHVGGDRAQLKQAIRHIIEIGEAQNILEGLARTQKHLGALSKLMEAALTRMFVVLEELGYSPDNPPPDSRVN